MGPAARGLMLVELRAVAVWFSRPGSALFLLNSSPLLVPGVCEGLSKVVS
jgi:hypothetical protein